MHTVHFPKEPKNDFIAAAVGIMFSVNDHTADISTTERDVIDAFFDGLKWDDVTGSVVSDMILYGDLMEMVDGNNRWIYKGSVTTPPCATFVYWNVLSTIYPVSQSQLDKFVNKQLAKGEEGMLDDYGNWREIQAIDKHNVIYLKNDAEEGAAGKGGGTIREMMEDNSKYVIPIMILAIVAVGAIILAALLFFMKAQEKQASEKKYATMEQELFSARSQKNTNA